MSDLKETVENLLSRSARYNTTYLDYMERIVLASRQQDLSWMLDLVLDIAIARDWQEISEEEYTRLMTCTLGLNGLLRKADITADS